MLVAIEGIDGSGKGTVARMLVDAIGDGSKLPRKTGAAKLMSFPDYTGTIYGKVVGRYLNGEFGKSLPAEIRSLLFAMDRFEQKAAIDVADHTGVLVCDRYVPSNMAYAAMDLQHGELDAACRLISYTEYGLLKLQPPDVIVVLDMPVEFAAQNVVKKATRSYTEAAADLHEANMPAMARVRDFYQTKVAELHPFSSVYNIPCVVNGKMIALPDVCNQVLSCLSFL